MELKYFELANKLNENYLRLLIENEVHFRPSINSISMISISNDKPELGIKCNASKYKTSTNLIDIIEKDISKVKSFKKPLRPTPEKELQSWIIKYALNNNHRLPFVPDIKFITSELAIQSKSNKKTVTDILGYNKDTQQLYIIELKSDRLLKRLIQQVSDFENVILENTQFFSQLISIHGFASPVDFLKKIKKVIVWPEGKTSPKEEFKRESIIEITYQGHYSFLHHS
jgi:hypothetical protein